MIRITGLLVGIAALGIVSYADAADGCGRGWFHNGRRCVPMDGPATGRRRGANSTGLRPGGGTLGRRIAGQTFSSISAAGTSGDIYRRIRVCGRGTIVRRATRSRTASASHTPGARKSAHS